MLNRLFLILLIASGCAPQAITYFNEEGAKFQEFKTYRLLNPKIDRTNLSKEGRDILDALEASIRKKMAERGYEESNLSPDLILRYEIVTSQHTDSRSNVLNPYGSPVSSNSYMESLIILDITDAGRKKMFWQSSYDLRQHTKAIKREDATEDAVSEIFYSYPYKAEQKAPDPKLADWRTGRKEIKAERKVEKKEAKISDRQNRSDSE